MKEKLRNAEQSPDNRSTKQPAPHFFFDKTKHRLIGPTGESIKLRSQSLEVFLLLLKKADTVVDKDDILSTVWNGISVTDDSIIQCVADIRRVLGKEHRSLLQTVPKIGYRLCLGSDASGNPIISPLEIQNAKEATSQDDTKSTFTTNVTAALERVTQRDRITNKKLALMACIVVILVGTGSWLLQRQDLVNPIPEHGPILAVLPFENISASVEDSYFSDGITEDIIALLSRFSELGMVSWTAVSNRSANDDQIKAIADEFGVSYLVSGSVRFDEKRVRVVVSLTDASDGRMLWTERYDERLEDVFIVQDRIASQIAATLAVKLNRIETELSRNIPTNNMAAYHLSLLGRHEFRKRNRTSNLTARGHFAEAIALDSGYADAYTKLGETLLEEAIFGWTEWPQQSTDKAMELGKKAIELDGPNARSLGFLAHVQVRNAEYSKAQNYLDRAFQFNPNDTYLHEIQGLLYLWSGHAEDAIKHLEFVLRYEPDSTSASSHLCAAYYVVGRPADAVVAIGRMIETAPSVQFGHIILTAAYVETGDIESAKEAAAVVRQRHPFITAEGASKIEFFTYDDVRRRFAASLKRAGID